MSGGTMSIADQSTDCPAEPMDAEDHALRPLHQRLHRQAQGHHAHDRRISGRRQRHDASMSSICTKTTSTGATADVGWITGHSYVVYGPLSNGATTLMYEGAPNFPDFSRFWAMIERHKVTRLLHRADRHPRLHARRPASWSTSTISSRCGCSARSASRSIPKRGCGITKSSATSNARSSIPGGRPKPA